MDDVAPPASLDERERTLAWLSYLFAPVMSALVLALARPTDRFARWHAIHSFALGLIIWAVSWTVFAVVVAGSDWPPTSAIIFAWLSILLTVFLIALMFAAHRGKKWGVPGLTSLANRFA